MRVIIIDALNITRSKVITHTRFVSDNTRIEKGENYEKEFIKGHYFCNYNFGKLNDRRMR